MKLFFVVFPNQWFCMREKTLSTSCKFFGEKILLAYLCAYDLQNSVLKLFENK